MTQSVSLLQCRQNDVGETMAEEHNQQDQGVAVPVRVTALANLLERANRLLTRCEDEQQQKHITPLIQAGDYQGLSRLWPHLQKGFLRSECRVLLSQNGIDPEGLTPDPEGLPNRFLVLCGLAAKVEAMAFNLHCNLFGLLEDLDTDTLRAIRDRLNPEGDRVLRSVLRERTA